MSTCQISIKYCLHQVKHVIDLLNFASLMEYYLTGFFSLFVILIYHSYLTNAPYTHSINWMNEDFKARFDTAFFTGHSPEIIIISTGSGL